MADAKKPKGHNPVLEQRQAALAAQAERAGGAKAKRVGFKDPTSTVHRPTLTGE